MSQNSKNSKRVMRKTKNKQNIQIVNPLTLKLFKMLTKDV